MTGVYNEIAINYIVRGPDIVNFVRTPNDQQDPTVNEKGRGHVLHFPERGSGHKTRQVVTSEEVKWEGKGEEERVIMRPHGEVGCSCYLLYTPLAQ